MTLQDGKLSVREYWSLHPSEQPASEADLIEQLDGLLSDAVRLQMRADVPVGVFLSGGLDSSIVSALMRVNTEQTVHAFTIKFSAEDQKFEQMTPDEVYARQVAKQFGFTYHELEIQPQIEELLPKMVWHLDEPLSDPAAINTYLISQAARDSGHRGAAERHGRRRGVWRLSQASGLSDRGELSGHRARGGPADGTVRGRPDSCCHFDARTEADSLGQAVSFLCFGPARATRYLMSDLSVAPKQFSQMFASRMSYYDSHFYQSQAPRFNGNGLSYLTQMCLNDTLVFLPEHNLTYSDKAIDGGQHREPSSANRPPHCRVHVLGSSAGTHPWS